jgi:hypothetical protein
MNKDELIYELRQDRVLAHQVLFRHRHPDPDPGYSPELVTRWHDPKSLTDILMCFRGSAKTTISEEAFIIRALFGEFENGLVLGENQPRAIEKLQSIKHEFETNEVIHSLFGYSEGPIWRDTKIVLSNGVCIQAVGSGQGMRGTKHYSARPDCVLCDDVEGDKDASTPEQREATRRWFFGVVLPACAPPNRRIIRIAGTPLDAESLLIEVGKLPGWRTSTIPIKYINQDGGEWVSSWPERFPLEEIDKIEQTYELAGQHDTFAREYMCQAISEGQRSFKSDMFRSEPLLHTYQATYAVYDPARTVNKRSAHTGEVVFSWDGPRLLVWRSGGHFWMPDEIVGSVFETIDRFRPVTVGIERDGLEEFILQPLRIKALETGTYCPVTALKAPRGKDDFIRNLQPFFKAGEVIFVGDGHEQLKSQLVNFPTGRKDIPNALAYALVLRPAKQVYSFWPEHIVHEMRAWPDTPLWLVLNSDQRCTVGILIQLRQGKYRVLMDWCRDGTPAELVPDILKEAGLVCERRYSTLIPDSAFVQRDIIGLRPAVRGMRIEPRRGGERGRGVVELHDALGRQGRVSVSPTATWTIRALSSGYTIETKDGVYNLIAEAIESFMSRCMIAKDAEDNVRMAETRDGREYITALP